MNKTKHTFSFLYDPRIRKAVKINPDQFKDAVPAPLIPIEFYYGTLKIRAEALIDSGADKIIFPKKIAKYLKLPEFEIKKCSGIGGRTDRYETEVGLKIGRAGKISELGILPASYTDNDDIPILIGREPIFNEYKIIFEQYKNKFHS